MQRIDQLNNITPSNTRTDLRGWLKTGLLFGLGFYFIYVIASGSLANYINARFAWLSYVAVVLFFLLGLSSAFNLLRKQDGSSGHREGALSWGVLAIVAVPLVLGSLIPSRPLGASAVGGNISVSAVGASTTTTFTTDPLKWTVLDWLRAFNRSEDINSFNGKEAEVVGFVYREATFGNEQFMVARFTISCCVADSSAIGLPVFYADAQNFPQDTWVRVHGTFQVGEFRDDTVPVLMADSIEIIPQPEHPYIYP